MNTELDKMVRTYAVCLVLYFICIIPFFVSIGLIIFAIICPDIAILNKLDFIVFFGVIFAIPSGYVLYQTSHKQKEIEVKVKELKNEAVCKLLKVFVKEI